MKNLCKLSVHRFSRLTFILTCFVGAFAATNLEAGTTYSKVWSMNRMLVPSNTDQWIAVSGHQKSQFQGRVQNVSANVVQVFGAPGWAPNDFAAGGTVGACYLKVLSGTDEGACYPILSNGSDSVETRTGLNSPLTSSLAAGDYVAIIPCWTLGSWTDKPANLEKLYLLNRNATGINNGAVSSSTYYADMNPATGKPWGWWIGSMEVNDRVLEMDEALIVRNNSTIPLIHTQAGEISMTKHYRRLEFPVAGAGQDHFLTFSGATPQTIGSLVSLAQNGDKVYFFNANLSGINKGAAYSATYYGAINSATGQPWGWWIGNTDVNMSEALLPGSAVLYRQNSIHGGSSRVWTDLPNYL